MANFPTSAPSFTVKSNGQIIDASHINSLQDEVVAIGGGYVNGTAPLNSSNSTLAGAKVTGAFVANGAVNLASTVTTNLSSGNTNNLDPTNNSSVFAMRILPHNNGSTLTGISRPIGGALKLLVNVHATVPLGIIHDGVGSSVGVRFATRTATDTSIPANTGTMLIWYDDTVGYWRQIS